MPDDISLTYGVQVGTGVSFNDKVTITVDAYDKFSAVLPKKPDAAAAADQVMTLGLDAATADTMRVLLIRAKPYGKELTVKINDAATVFKLDSPILISGSSAKDLLPGGAAVTKLTFNNGLASPVAVDVLIGRVAA